MTFKMDLRKFPRGEDGNLALHGQPDQIALRGVPSFQRDLKREILLFVNTAGRPVSRSEICKELGFSKNSTHYIPKLESLVQEGYLNRVNGYWRNGFVMYFYEVPE